MLAYYEGEGFSFSNLELVKVLKDDGERDPRYRYYGIANEACIDIVLKQPPVNDIVVVSTPMDLKFCASGCGIPGVDATK